jgi:hypothetical protein
VPRDCPPDKLAEKIKLVADDQDLRDRIRSAQDDYAAAHSYQRVAKRYAELLAL